MSDGVVSQQEEAAWYCVRSQRKHEHIAAARLRQFEEIEVFCPRVRIQRSTRRGLVWFVEALFPNYLFARFEMDRWRAAVRSCPGVRGLVSFGLEVPAVPESALEALRARLPEDELLTVTYELAPGDAVEIVEGPFRGQTAVVERLLPARERVRVLLEVLGGANAVDLQLTAVFKDAPLVI